MIENINISIRNKRILIAPLDWGLGHTTRCIPLITALLKQENEVYVAAASISATIIRDEFPDINILPLRGYGITYSKRASSFFWKMLFQLPKMISAIIHEKRWLNNAIDTHGFDVVISDNRLGLRSNKTQSIFITHQLKIKTKHRLTDFLLQKINYYFINQFDECWVPDFSGSNNLAGDLSHPIKLPKVPVKYIGLLSRLESSIQIRNNSLVFILSGPEPQRTIFENIIVKQLKQYNKPVILIRGVGKEENALQNLGSNIVQYNYASSNLLNGIIQQSDVVIARSGYSTIMDLVTLNQQAILVPTPGQTEQEYLAGYLFKKKLFYTVTQDQFDLQKDLLASLAFREVQSVKNNPL